MRSINLLAALCQCNDEAIGSNQDHVCGFLLDEDSEYGHLLIDVAKRPNGTHYAIFREPEILAVNKGKQMEIDIQDMESKLAEIG
jgi:hypothetical protein